MKELSIEERAQRYDEAIERVVNIRTGKCETTFIFTEGLFNYLFPELEECNGEEVRKAMIDFFKHEREEGVTVFHYGVNIERMIAWLEKQSQVNETIISQHENKTCKENNDSLTSEEAMQYLKENHSPSEVSDFQAAMNIAVAKAYDKGVKDGLENRGQTFTKKEVDDAYLAGVRDAKKELEKQGEQNPIMAKSPQLGEQKPANNNEPKFHKNAWSADDYLWQITGKEQLDFLYTKIKEAGFEWDAEKKELKKIENEIEIPFGAKDSELQEATYFIPQGFHAEIDDDKVVIKKGEKSTAWSEEDDDNMMMIEDRLRDYLDYIREDSTLKKHIKNSLKEEVSEYIDWLKSIKQRIIE